MVLYPVDLVKKISRFYGNSDVKCLNYGAEKDFIDRVPMSELVERYHLSKELIIEDLKRIL